MSGGYQQRSHLGATFYPGGQDDFYMPELVSPTPQRVMPEVPSNMQEGLATLELEAREQQFPQGNRASTQSTISSMQSPPFNGRFESRVRTHEPSPSNASKPSGPGFTASYEHTNASAYQNINSKQEWGTQRDESPKFSPFPKLQNPGPNVPFSDEDKEEVLERARPLVLQSSDPEMQLAWAQDALSWVEVANQNYIRGQSEGQSARSATPKVEHQLRVDALSIVNFLADQDHPKAKFMKGMWLEFGKFGYRVDKKEAFLAYRRAAERGYSRAEYRIGMQYEGSNNSAKAIEHYQKGVSMNDSASNYRLGMMTLLGQHGTPQSYTRGLELIQFAADTADENAPQGAYVYGMLLAHELNSISIPEQHLEYDVHGAKLYIEKAAYLGFSKAQLKMAQAYELCQLGCEFEPALSLHYNALAARQGESEADMAISKWFLCGYEGIFEKNEELAFTFAKRAAGTKMATAEFAMGYFYEIGMFVPVDLQESESWYQKALDHGNKDAIERISSIRGNRTLNKEDHEQMAISRIKSQYGSQRGGRPDRFKQKAAPMPIMAEDAIDMPDPSKHSYVQPQQRQNGPPTTRPVSNAPYPENDIAPPKPPYNNQGLRPNSSGGPHADRPSSAFGIRPLSHAATETSLTQHHGNDPSRPSTSMGSMPMGISQNSTRRDHDVSGSWDQQQQYHPGNQAPTLPQLDFNPRPGPMNSRPAQSNTNKPYPQQPQAPQLNIPNQSYSADVNRLSQHGFDSPTIQRRDPSANNFVRPDRRSSRTPVGTSPASNQRPAGYENGQGQNYGQTPPQGRQAQRPPPLQQAMSSQSEPRYPSPTISAQQQQPPRKTGPATFEEMGIPQAKKEEECSIM